MLKARVLAAISATPGITAAELRRRFGADMPWRVHNAVTDLRREGRVVTVAHGRYDLARRGRPPASPVVPSSGFVSPPPLARLMAGR